MKNIYHKHSFNMKNIYQGIYMKEQEGEKHKINIFYKNIYIHHTPSFSCDGITFSLPKWAIYRHKHNKNLPHPYLGHIGHAWDHAWDHA